MQRTSQLPEWRLAADLGVRRTEKQGSVMNVPTETDWGVPTRDDLDAAYARRVFLGKTAQDALAMFRENVLERVEDLRFMPPVPFRYYMLAFRTFVVSDAALEDQLARAEPQVAS
jgi:hypothetical protein